MTARMNRRGFLRAATCAGTSFLVLRHSRSALSYPANEKLNIAVVGVGNRGTYHARTILKGSQKLVVICDANRDRPAELLKIPPGISRYQDFRKMLDEMDGRIDAVIVATTDHNHAVVSAAAMKHNKHVYCEKPVAHDVREARALRQIARQQKVATQMGNQGMASDSFRRTLELIEEGVVGEIREVHAWYVFGGSGPREVPKGSAPVPEYLDWDVWLGPARFRPYHPLWVSSAFGWRDFGTGCLGGGGSHSINLAFKALKLGALWEAAGKDKANIRVEAETSERCIESFPRWEILRFDLPARGPLPPVQMHWYNAPEPQLQRMGIWERLEKVAGRSLEWKDGSWTPRSGSLLVGSKGVVHTNAHNSSCALLPESDFPDSGGPPRKLPHVESHQQEWFRACKGQGGTLSNFDHAGPAIELLLLGNVATLVGQALEFDPVACKIVNNAEADALLRPKYREGWSL
jgi:hypothetical protein